MPSLTFQVDHNPTLVAEASFIVSASYALTASYALNGGGSPISTAPVSITYASNLTVDASAITLGRCILTGDVTIEAPSNPSDGMRLELWLTAFGGTHNLTIDSAIKISSAATSFSNPLSMTSGGCYILVLLYDAVQNDGQWEAVSLTGAF